MDAAPRTPRDATHAFPVLSKVIFMSVVGSMFVLPREAEMRQ